MPKQQRATIILSSEDRQRERAGKTAVEVMHEQQARRFELLKKQMGIFDKPAWQLMLDDIQNRVARFTRQQFCYLPDSLVPKSAFKASKALKQSAELLVLLINSRTALYELARLFAALSLHELRKQNNINDRVIIAMTEKFTLVQLSSEKISYRHDAPHKPAH
jgi:competence protein ComGC